MNKLLRKKNQGFTLIELMIVVVIIGILAATAIPAFLRFVTRSKTTETSINLKVLAEGASAYYNREFVPQGWSATLTSSTACFVGNADTQMTIDSDKRIWDGVSGVNAAGLTGTAVGIAGLGWGPADNMYYRYLIANSRQGCGQDDAGAALTMRAHGNLDGDSVTSLFEMAMGVIPASGLGHGPMYVSSELE